MLVTVPQAQGFIADALGALQIDYPASRRVLLLGTAIQESGLEFVHQIGGGPALGLWQMEPATHDSLWQNFIAYRPHFQQPLTVLLNSLAPDAQQLVTNHAYAAAMAALRYFDSKAVMPTDPSDIAGCAMLWKTFYNTAGGAGSEQEFIDNYNRVVQDSAA